MASDDAFGITQLDRLLTPPPAGATVALVNEPGVEGEPFLYQAANHHLSAGRTVLYAVFNRAPENVRHAMNGMGYETGPSTRIRFLDAYSPMMGTSSDADFIVQPATDPQALAKIIEQLAAAEPGAVLILDGLTTLLDQSGPDNFLDAFKKIRTHLPKFHLTIALLTRWPYGDEFTTLLQNFDAEVALKGVEERVLLGQYFSVQRASWSPGAAPKPIPYRIIKPGGVLVYIPKIVVTGAYHAGKSTFVQTISDTAVSVNRLGTTVAMDHGHVTIDGLTADIFGTPGQERFDPLLKTITGQALGVVLVVDSTRPDSFPRALEMMGLLAREGLPILIAANKQDAPDALAPGEVAARLQTPPHVRVIGCVGRNRASALGVLRVLIDQIMHKVSP